MASTQPTFEDEFVDDSFTRLVRVHARTMICGDVPTTDSSEGSEVATEISASDKIGGTERLKRNAKKEFRDFRKKLQKRMMTFHAAKNATLSKMRLRLRRGAKSKSFGSTSRSFFDTVRVAEDTNHLTVVDSSNGLPKNFARSRSTSGQECGPSLRNLSTVFNEKSMPLESQSQSLSMDDEASRNVSRSSLATSGTIRVNDEIADQASIAGDLGGGISNWNTDAISLEIQSLLDQYQRQAEAYAAKSRNLAFAKSTSIPARINAFHFSTLVPMGILSRFAPTYRVLLKTNNCLVARRDMVQLSQIWSRLVGSAPILWDLELNNPLRNLEKADGERLCELMEEGLHRCVYWASAAKTSAIYGEGAMASDWWQDFEAKLKATGSLDAEAIAEQLVVVASDNVNVPALESVARAIKALEADVASEMAYAPHDSREAFKGNTNSPSAPVTRRKEIGPEIAERSAIKQVKLRSATSSHTHSAAAKDLIISVEGCDKETASSSGTDISPSSDILREVTAALDAAVAGRTVSPPESLKRGSSQVPRPLNIKKSQRTLPKEEAVRTWPLESQVVGRQVPPPITTEHKQSSVTALDKSRPEDIYSGPTEISNNAKGKLPVTRSSSTWTSVALPGTAVKSAEHQTFPRSNLSKVPTPRVTPGSTVSGQTALASKSRVPSETRGKQANPSPTGLPRHTVTRAQVLEAARGTVSTSIKPGSESSWKVSRHTVMRATVQNAAPKPSSLPRKVQATKSVASTELQALVLPLAVVSGTTVDDSRLCSNVHAEKSDPLQIISWAPSSPVTSAKASTFPNSKIPVLCRPVMPGTWPVSDSE